MKKIFSNSLSPHFTLSDIPRIFHAWLKITSNTVLHKNFAKIFGEHFLLGQNARELLKKWVQIMQPDKQKKIGIPAFTCLSVATPFLSEGYEIEWIECDKNGLISLTDFKKKSAKISTIIIIHTFGQVVDIMPFQRIAQAKKIWIIEDSSHSFGSKDEARPISSNFEITSFGREKSLSCVGGGMLRWQKKFAKKIDNPKLQKPNTWIAIRLMFHPIIFSIALPIWHWGGKYLIAMNRLLKLIPLAVSKEERQAQQKNTCHAMHSWQKKLLFSEAKKLNNNIAQRKEKTKAWTKKIKQKFIHVRLIEPENGFRSVLVFKNEKSKNLAKKLFTEKGFFLQEWDGVPISPAGVNLKKFGYQKKQCPQAENFAKIYLTLPTNKRINLADINSFDTKNESCTNEKKRLMYWLVVLVSAGIILFVFSL